VDAGGEQVGDDLVTLAGREPRRERTIDVVVMRATADACREAAVARPLGIAEHTAERSPVVVGDDRQRHPLLVAATRVHTLRYAVRPAIAHRSAACRR
jgi:hypothetical protein